MSLFCFQDPQPLPGRRIMDEQYFVTFKKWKRNMCFFKH